MFECDICKKNLSSKYSLQTHMNAKHLKIPIYKCEICGKECYTKEAVRVHKIYHANLQQYKCKYCGNGYNTLNDCTRHERIHLDERPFKCKLCDASFKFMDALRTHNKGVHIKNYTFKCTHENCELLFLSKSKLKRHMKSHSDDRPFMCTYDDCCAAFKEKDKLTRHLQTHSITRDFKCELCYSTFKSQGELNTHTYKHQGRYKIECNICKQTLSNKQKLKKHVEVFHTENGSARSKRKELEIRKVFQDAEMKCTEQYYVNFRSLYPTDTFAYIDFMFQNQDTIFLVEVDEFQHNYEELIIELSRMDKVRQVLLQIYPSTQHIVWIRYNPDTFRIAKKQQIIPNEKRQDLLKTTIQTYKPTLSMEILYMYYNMDKNHVLNVTKDPEYTMGWLSMCKSIY